MDINNTTIRKSKTEKKRYGFLIIMLLAAFAQLACDKIKDPQAQSQPGLIVTIDPAKVYQTIHSFGASDCWTTKYVGQWANEKKKNQIADFLFAMDTMVDGSPKGIGLSLWRFNIGGGSFEQGQASGIADDWRREECFLDEQGRYHWDKQQGQQWFLRAAKNRGVRQTVGFSLTPPVFMTKNGKAYNDAAAPNMNIRADQMESYADFLARVTEHFEFDYLSPVNEPQWQWGKASGANQEGTQATNAEIANLVRLLNTRLEGSRSNIIIAEAGQWNYLYEKNIDDRGNQVAAFFSPTSPSYVGDLPTLAPVITGHSYFTTCPGAAMVRVRERLKASVAQVRPDLELWQTEFGILGNICNQYTGAPRNTGIDYGLYVARVIHHDLAVANVSSWQWWLAVSPYNYSDALVYINAPSATIDPSASKEDGLVSDSKQLWVLGNYSRFIRPGMQRIDAMARSATPNTQALGILVSAYKETTTKKTVLVIANTGEKEKVLELQGLQDDIVVYTTNHQYNLRKTVGRAPSLPVPSKSVLTVVGTHF